MSAQDGHDRIDSQATLNPQGLSSFIGTANIESPYIPLTETGRRRTLVLCFDGTGDQFDSDNSNIVQLFSMLKKDDRSLQMVYYQAGIGTYTSPAIATPLAAKFSKSLDEAIAWNLDAHVMDGYEFLMQNYTAGDKICIFGFSRGAYTARSLAGMIHKVGLLPACNHQQVPFAYKMYSQEDEIGWQQSNAFKKAFSIDVDIEFLGVWDTVNSVGLLPRRLPFTTSNKIVKTFRHAIALDERRAKFKANHWNRPNKREQKLSISDQPIVAEPVSVEVAGDIKSDAGSPSVAVQDSTTSGASAAPPSGTQKSDGGTSGKERRRDRQHIPHKQPTLRQLEHRYGAQKERPETDILEVWFAGCHCDVGGGSVSNDTPHSLARIPLRWMIRECFKTDCGIVFYKGGLREIGLEPNSLFPYVKPRPPALSARDMVIQNIPDPKAKVTPSLPNYSGALAESTKDVLTEEQLDLLDGMSPVYDQLSLAWGWWFLELLPVKQRRQKSDDTWVTWYEMNMGSGRIVPKQRRGVKVHRSVQARMDAKHETGEKYRPKANLDFSFVEWVD